MKRRIKRKIKRMFHNHNIFLFLVVLIPVLLLMATGYALMQSELLINGTASIPEGIGGGGEDPEGPDDKKDVCAIKLTWELNHSWNDGLMNYEVIVTITNDSDITTQEWVLVMPAPKNSTVVSYEATYYELDGYVYFASQSYNAEMQPGASVSFKIQILRSSDDLDRIMSSLGSAACGLADNEEGEREIIRDGEAYLELGQLEVPLDAKFTLRSTNNWGSTVNIYDLTITNNSGYDISSWRGMIWIGNNASDPSKTDFYPVTITEKTNQYIIFRDNYGNGFIANGASLTSANSQFTLTVYVYDPSWIPNIVVAGVRKTGTDN